MPVLEEKTLVQKEVQADTGHSATRTAAHDTGLFQSFLELLLELPVPVVLLTLWLLGAALVGLCALALYPLLWVLLGALAIP